MSAAHSDPQIPAAAPGSPRRRRFPAKTVLMVIALLIVAAGGGFAWARHHEKQARRAPKGHRWQKKRPAKKKPAKAPAAPKPEALNPDEEAGTFTVEPGFRVELVASEPLVRNPVALAFDPQGRVWVCEMQGYMTDVNGTGENEPAGQVVILEDTDGDGRLDRRTVFLEHLVLPRAIALVKDGALIAEPPNLWFCPDRDGDGKADEKILVDERYSAGTNRNPEHLPNGLTWAMDNQVYSAGTAIRYRARADGGFERSQTDFRGQWGLTQDDWGRLFYNYNLSQLHADIFSSSDYLQRAQSLIREGNTPPTTLDQRVWPGHPTPGLNAGDDAQRDEALRTFTSACGPVIYRGNLFPPEFHGNAFLCEPARNFIRRDVLRYWQGGVGASIASEGREFFTSRDERFRPVNLYTGPDGALWVVDMYCGIIEHSTYMTGSLKKYILQQGLEKPVGLGRIWRIVPEGAKGGAWPRLATGSAAELVAQLEHPNGWQRDTAQRLLVEKGEAGVAPALVELLAHAKDERARLHALWTLQGLEKLEPVILAQALRDPGPNVRAAAIRLSEPWLAKEPALEGAVLGMTGDAAPEAQVQLMLTLGGIRSEEATKAMVALLLGAGEKAYCVHRAALTGLRGREMEFLTGLASATGGQPIAAPYLGVIQSLTAAILTAGQPEPCGRLLQFVSEQPALPQKDWLEALVRNPRLDLDLHRPVPLPQEPGCWAALGAKLSPDDARKLANLFSWPGKPSKLEKPEVPLNEIQQARFAKGRELFGQSCAVCHQADGQGQSGLAPPLANSEWVLGSEERLTRIVLDGLMGPVTVAGQTYFLEMPALGAMDDEQIASILTYIRRAWGHAGAPVDPKQTAEIRAANGRRGHPWTVETLSRFP